MRIHCPLGQDAVATLNSLQSNAATVLRNQTELEKTSKPEMRDWCDRLQYKVTSCREMCNTTRQFVFFGNPDTD